MSCLYYLEYSALGRHARYKTSYLNNMHLALECLLQNWSPVMMTNYTDSKSTWASTRLRHEVVQKIAGLKAWILTLRGTLHRHSSCAWITERLLSELEENRRGRYISDPEKHKSVLKVVDRAALASFSEQHGLQELQCFSNAFKTQTSNRIQPLKHQVIGK